MPSAATAPSIQTTGWSLAASSASGKKACAHSKCAKGELDRREQERPRALSQRSATVCWHSDPTSPPSGTRPRPRPATGRSCCGTLLEEVIVKVERDKAGRPPHAALERRRAHRYQPGAAALAAGHDPHRRGHDRARSPTGRPLPRRRDRRHPQSPRTNYGARPSLRGQPRRQSPAALGYPLLRARATADEGELASIKKAATALGVAPSTIHRWLNDGIIPGEQLTPGAPWRIRSDRCAVRPLQR